MSTICRLRPFVKLSLYLVADRPSFSHEELFLKKIQEAVKGGVSCVQLRDHKSSFSAALKTAQRLKSTLGNTPLFINTLNSLDIARAAHADGVYLEEAIPYTEARNWLGSKAIIGIPVKTMNDVLTVAKTNAIDYLSVKISPSKKTCPKNDIIWGMEGLRKIRAISPHRIVAIGGLNLENFRVVYQELRSDDGIAMAGGLMAEKDPCQTAQKIQTVRKQIRGNL